MIITATKEHSKAIFKWNDDLSECHHTALGVSDQEFKQLMDNKVHEGNDLEGWGVQIEMN
jgi:hypothetical protein